ncbi:galactose-1-phosphate uridylyltransferase [Acidobacteriota bacterium]
MSELRRDPISGQWIIVAEHQPVTVPRNNEAYPVQADLEICPFCPGQEMKTPSEILAYAPQPREPNAPGWSLRVIPNRIPVLQIEGDLEKQGVGVYDRMNGIGAHEIIIETPEHEATLSTLPEKSIEDLMSAYCDRILDLRRDERFRYILIFKNHGKAAGAKLRHSHSQLIALPVTPKRVTEEIEGAKKYYAYRDRCIYCDIVQQELNDGERIVSENDGFLSIVPYASRYPFETWIIPKTHEPCFESGRKQQRLELARIFSESLQRIDNGLGNPAYNCILHTSPFGVGSNPYYHWHFEIAPRLLNVAGFESGSGFFINPTPPEKAAKHLREAVIG